MRTVGKRLDGRAFLHDYDWRKDEGFSILKLILTAPVVVASWISLQYYGSTVAPQLFGAGNKLLHNVVGGFGVFEGKTFAEIEAHWPEQARRWRQRDPEFAPEGGESLLQFRQRVTGTAQRLAASHRGEQIVLVGHGGVMDVLYRAATGQELQAPRTWELGNAAINRLLWSEQGFTLVGWSDRRHLEDEPLDETTA